MTNEEIFAAAAEAECVIDSLERTDADFVTIKFTSPKGSDQSLTVRVDGGHEVAVPDMISHALSVIKQEQQPR